MAKTLSEDELKAALRVGVVMKKCFEWGRNIFAVVGLWVVLLALWATFEIKTRDAHETRHVNHARHTAALEER